MEKVAQQELCLLFALIDVTGRRCSKRRAAQVAILKGSIYRVAPELEQRPTIQNSRLLTPSPLIPLYFAEVLHGEAKQITSRGCDF